MTMKTLEIVVLILACIATCFCSTNNELDSELDLSLVTPYEIKPTCSNCSNETSFSDSFLQFSQGASLKQLLFKTDSIQEIKTSDSIYNESELKNTTIQEVRVDLNNTVKNITSAPSFSNFSAMLSLNNSSEIVPIDTLVNNSLINPNLANDTLNAYKSSTIIITSTSTEKTQAQIETLQVTTEDIESKGASLRKKI